MEYRLGYTTSEESKKFVELGVKVNTADFWISPEGKYIGRIETPIQYKTLPSWSITRIVDILENNGIKVSYEDKSWCLKTNVIENGKRHCFVGGSLPKLVIEMLESKIVKLK